MITLIGLLPMALTTFRETKRDTVHANILQYVTAEANLTPYANMVASLSTTSSTPWTFDDQGEVIKAATTNAADTSPVVYSAYITVSPSTPSGAALLPGYTADPLAYSTNTYLLTVEIVDTDQPKRPTTNTIVVANMGK
jgi:uncharacterized protein (TIGR02598 family)